jgi:hypothetical protein
MTDLYGNPVYGPVARPNWTSVTGVENLTSNMEFLTIVTSVPIGSDFPDVPNAFGVNPIPGPTAPSAGAVYAMNNLNKLLEIIAERGQPIIIGNVAVTGTITPSTAVGPAPAYAPIGSPTGGLYTLFMATEHLGWTALQPGGGTVLFAGAVVGGPRLIDRIVSDGINFGFGADTALSVSIGSFLT